MKKILLVGVLGVSLAAAGCGQSSQDKPAFLTFDAKVAAHARAIYQRGLTLGNRPDVFAKVGDSNTAAGAFLRDIGCGRAQLGTHRNLEATVRFFSRRELPPGYVPFFDHPAPCPENNSFVRRGFSVHNGWGAASLLAPFPPPVVLRHIDGRYFPNDRRHQGGRLVTMEGRPMGRCSGVVRTSLQCELQTVKPSIALIMIGTNDIRPTPLAAFRTSLQRIVSEVTTAGTIPVLSTIPPRVGRSVKAFNAAIVDFARRDELPLWNLWSSLQSNHAMNQGVTGDGVHLSVYRNTPADLTAPALRYGMNLRNLQALEVLDLIRRRVLSASPDPPD